MTHVDRALIRCVLAGVLAGPLAVGASPPSSAAIVRLCSEADGAEHCERLIEAEQMKQFPGIAVRDGGNLRLIARPGSRAVELRNSGEPGVDPGAEFRAYALWDYWPQRRTAVVSVTARDNDYYLLVDVERGTQTRIAAEPLLAPDGQRFVVSDLCDTQCGNVVEVWRFDSARLIKERTFKPLEKWYEAEVKWRDAATLSLEYSVATPEPGFNAAGERILVKARPRLMKLSDWAWIDEERKR
ncbi:MAG: hypothetical protein ABI831_15765 [Betaproteobacteria bacterium]